MVLGGGAHCRIAGPLAPDVLGRVYVCGRVIADDRAINFDKGKLRQGQELLAIL